MQSKRLNNWVGCFLLLLMASNAFGAKIKGRVSTGQFQKFPTGIKYFILVSNESLSLTENNIQKDIASHIEEKGFVQAIDRGDADLIVLYSYSVGDSSTVVSGYSNIVTGGTDVYSTVVRPRYFEVSILDGKKSQLPEKPVILWQGEIYSQGRSADISLLAPHFIDQIFLHFGETVSNLKFKARINLRK